MIQFTDETLSIRSSLSVVSRPYIHILLVLEPVQGTSIAGESRSATFFRSVYCSKLALVQGTN